MVELFATWSVGQGILLEVRVKRDVIGQSVGNRGQSVQGEIVYESIVRRVLRGFDLRIRMTQGGESLGDSTNESSGD